MNKSVSEIYNLVQELSWYFGNQGFDGNCCDDLTLVEFMAVKKVCENNNISIQEIGNQLNVTKSGVSKIINRLENKGYVIRVQSSLDGRVCCVEITDKGIDVIKKIVELYTDYIGKILRNFESDTVDDIKSALELLTTSVREHGFIKQNEHNKGCECC